jgi:drug/metabolite transporter (DMT)-like permease
MRAYKSADLSLAYPLARATGPLFSVFAAIVLLNESPSTTALTGALLIIGGSVWIGITGAASSQFGPAQLKGIGFAVLCGSMIAIYTVLDQQSVTALGLYSDAGRANTALALDRSQSGVLMGKTRS